MTTRQELAEKQKERLEAKRSEAVAELDRLREWLLTEVDVEMDEGDPDIFEREKNLALVTSVERELESIERALRNIEQGNYGICERCGQEINPERLEARPDATLCLKCQVEVEKIAKRSASLAEQPPSPTSRFRTSD